MPIYLEEVGDRKILGQKMVEETIEKIKLLKKHLTTAQSQQKSYANNQRRDFEFKIGDHVFLKIFLIKDIIMRFRKKGKLSPRFIKPFDILEKVEAIAYKLALPLKLANIHNVFHVC